MRLIKDDIVRVCDQAVTQFCRVSGLPADDRLLQVNAIRPHQRGVEHELYRPKAYHRPQARDLGPFACPPLARPHSPACLHACRPDRRTDVRTDRRPDSRTDSRTDST
jgi:hypothetical protein